MTQQPLPPLGVRPREGGDPRGVWTTLTAAPFAEAKRRSNPSVGERIDGMWCIEIMEYRSALEKRGQSDMCISTGDPEDVTLSERRHRRTNTVMPHSQETVGGGWGWGGSVRAAWGQSSGGKGVLRMDGGDGRQCA